MRFRLPRLSRGPSGTSGTKAAASGTRPRHHQTVSRRRAAAVGASLALLAPLLTVAEGRMGLEGAVAATGVTAIAPNADAYVRSDQPTTNFGSKYVLAAQAASASTPEVVSYLRFNVSGLTAPPAKVTLQLYSYSSNTLGLQAWSADSSWTESTVTYATAPARSSTLAGSVATTTSNTWAAIDLTSAIVANGTYTFAITTTATGNKQWG
ncbi:MAG: CBM96 family carbohydrate-binding protein, partial [Actinomycetales bacterium]